MTNKLTILFIVLLLVSPVMAMSETVDIFGTNAINAQTNITKSGNQSVNVSIWNIDNGIKTFKINVTNITDTFTVTIHNITAGMVVEQRFNATSVNSYRADSTGTITFTQVQATGNRTYDIRPAINIGGYNATWGYIWNLTAKIFPLNIVTTSGNTVLQWNGTNFIAFNLNGLTIDGLTLTNVTIMNGTTINITTLNATAIAGSGAEISNLNLTNGTNPLPAVNGSALFGLDMSNHTTCSGNATCTYNVNGSVSIDAVSNTTAIFNNILNTSTVTWGRNANGSMQATSSGSGIGSSYFTANDTFTVPTGINRVWVTAWGGGGGGGGAKSGGDVPGGGGGGGGEVYMRKFVVGISPGEVITVEVGAGGTGGTIDVRGDEGANTTFGSYVRASGGYGGLSLSVAGIESGGRGGGNLTLGGGVSGTSVGGNGNRSTMQGYLIGGSTGGGAGIAAGSTGGRGADFAERSGGTGGTAGSNGASGGGAAGFNGTGGKGATSIACTAGGANTGAGGGGGSPSVNTGCAGGSGGLIVEW